MPVSYAQARDIMVSNVRPKWTHGTFYVDESEITEDDEMYVFTVGPRELLVDGDDSYQRVGSSLPVVFKDDGRLEWRTWVSLLNSRPGMQSRPNPGA
jgi:hypothetical protein